MTTDSDQRTETWKEIPGFPNYEAGDLGHVRSNVTGKTLATRVSNSGYLLVKPYDDFGKQQTRTVHSLVLLTFVGPRPPGMETLHGKGGPLDNRWPENLRYGTKEENEADKDSMGTRTPVPKKHPCVNHERCGGMTANPGRRCLPCVTEVGKDAAALLNTGMPLDRVAEQLGYHNVEWVYALATRHGGYSKPITHARKDHRPWPRRAMATIRERITIGGR